MKKWLIKSQVSLRGKTFVISMMELRNSPGEIMDAVELGATFEVQRSGETVAFLVTPPTIGFPIIEPALVISSKGEISYGT